MAIHVWILRGAINSYLEKQLDQKITLFQKNI